MQFSSSVQFPVTPFSSNLNLELETAMKVFERCSPVLCYLLAACRYYSTAQERIAMPESGILLLAVRRSKFSVMCMWRRSSSSRRKVKRWMREQLGSLRSASPSSPAQGQTSQKWYDCRRVRLIWSKPRLKYSSNIVKLSVCSTTGISLQHSLKSSIRKATGNGRRSGSGGYFSISDSWKNSMKALLHMGDSSSVSLQRMHQLLHHRKFFWACSSFLYYSLQGRASFWRVLTCITPRKEVPMFVRLASPWTYFSSLLRLSRFVWTSDSQGSSERCKSRKRTACLPPRKGGLASFLQWYSSKVASCSLFSSSSSDSMTRVIFKLPPLSMISIISSLLCAFEDVSPYQRKEWNLTKKEICFGESGRSGSELKRMRTDSFLRVDCLLASSRNTFSQPTIEGWMTEGASRIMLILRAAQPSVLRWGCLRKRQGVVQSASRNYWRTAAALRSWLAVARSWRCLQVDSAMVVKAWLICRVRMNSTIQTIFCTPSFLFF